MTQPNKLPKQLALQMVAIQAVVLAVFFVFVWLFLGWTKGYALLIGGLCAWIPALLYALLVFAKTSTQNTQRFVAIFYMGEFIKLMLSATLVAIAVVKYDFNTVFVLIGFIVTLLAFFVGASRMAR
jgi:ATP synthase protein I